MTLPARGGRLLIGSDGLWDAVHPKTAAHHTREMAAAEAAHKLLALAIKADKLKDDVTGGEEGMGMGMGMNYKERKTLARLLAALRKVVTNRPPVTSNNNNCL